MKSLILKLYDFLQLTLHLTLHPKKIHLQHYKKGVKFIGAVILPKRIYIANRTKGNFYNAIAKQNKIVQNRKPTKGEQDALLSSLNSYLGIMKHYKSFSIRKRMIFKDKTGLSGWWFNYLYLSGGIAKFVLKKKPTKKSKRWVTMAKKHRVLVANPDPEISYKDAIASGEDIFIATGRSDHPNQVNNVLGFPLVGLGENITISKSLFVFLIVVIK